MEFSTEIGGKKLVVKIGEMAEQANGSCLVQYGETTVLATAVLGGEGKELDYFPLSVEYEEKFYAAGKIKGSRFIKRETRPPDEAVLTGRLIDRSIRPLFDDDCRREVQVILTVLSVDQENDPDMVALWATSIALSISDIPWDGPTAGIRVGYAPIDSGEADQSVEKKKEFVLNPSYEIREKSELDLVLGGTETRILMVEGGAKEVDNETVLGAIKYGLRYLGEINIFIKNIQSQVGKTKIPLVGDLTSEDYLAKQELKRIAEEIVKKEAPEYLFKQTLKTKQDRIGAAEKIRQRLEEILSEKQIGKDKRTKAIEYANKLIYRQVGEAILDKGQRIDGRQLDEIRPVSCQVGILPRVHGSGIFNRGETQTISIVTLGAPGLEQYLDTMEESGRKRFMHHYNFPPFCSGEVKRTGSTSRREIGHGALAEKGITPMIPDRDEFSYTIRVVSEVLSSNGSSSMASTCSSVLALMDAGVPIKKPVAGVAIGLASEEGENKFKRYKILTDLQDLEDGPGGMDFKIIGTADGITAIQMDTKTKGLTMDVIEETLKASTIGRKKILVQMAEVLKESRPELSVYAPRVVAIKINPDKIRDVIGPGGKMINEIIAKTGAIIDVEQDGTVSVTSANKESLAKAIDMIKIITHEFKVGEIFNGKVSRMMDFGVFVEIAPGQDGMVHVSEMASHRVERPEDIVEIGDSVNVKIVEIDEKNRINLSMKALDENGKDVEGYTYRPKSKPSRSGSSFGGKGGKDDRGGRRPYSPRR